MATRPYENIQDGLNLFTLLKINTDFQYLFETANDAKEGRINFVDGSIGTVQLADNSVSNSKVMDDSITNEKIGARAVSNAELGIGAVDTSILALGAVYGSRIKDKGVTNAHLSIGSVSRDNLQENAVNASRIADKSIWERHIMTNSINRGMLQDGIVDYTKVEFDSLTLNKGKVFPMQQIGLDNKVILLNSILDVKVQFAEIGAKYSISFIAKDTTSWEETPQTFFQINKSYNDFESDEILIGRFEAAEQMIGNNQTGVKSHVIRWEGMDEVFTITVDWDELESNNNFRTDQVTNYIISPSQYFFKKTTKQPVDDLVGKLAFNINGNDIQFKERLNDTENMVYTFGYLTPNDFFEITQISTQDKNSPLNDYSGVSLLRSSTDWVSPYGMLVDNNPVSDGKFTVGGGHGTDGGSGFASGEFIGLYDIKVDGNTKANGNHLGNELTFRIEHFVSASNAIDLTTGQKRNTAKEIRYYKINKDGIHVEVRLEALEDITLTHYAGVQTIQRDTFDKFYMPGDTPEKLYPVTGLTDWTFPTLEDPQILDRVIMYNPDIVMIMKTDRTYGIGTGEHIPGSTADRLQRPIHATPNIGKIYMHNLGRSGNNYKLSTGEDIRYKGQWTFTENKSSDFNVVEYEFNSINYKDDVTDYVKV